MTTKHTLGPWKIDDAVDLPLAVIMDDENGMGVCEIGAPTQARDEAAPEQFANARLIAAAPRLLEACIEVLGYLDVVLPCDEYDNSPHVKMLHAAIREAGAG